MAISFYKDGNNWIINDVYTPKGSYRLHVESATEKVALTTTNNEFKNINWISVTEFTKIGGTPYTDLADFLTGVKDFFVDATDLVAVENRLNILENIIFKVAYYAEITSNVGTIIKPTGSTILLDQWSNGVDALVSRIIGGKPDYEDTGIDVSSFDTSGNYTLSGALPSNPAALIYYISINLPDLNNLDKEYIVGYPELKSVVSESISAGVIYPEPSLTDNGDGTVDIGTSEATLFTNADYSGAINTYAIAAQTGVSLTDHTTNYVIVNYNSGSPEYQVTTNVSIINESDIIPIFTIFRDGTDLFPLVWDSLGSGLPNKLHARFVKTQRFARESGLVLSENISRNVLISSGVVWYGAVKTPISAFDSSTDTLCLYYQTSGVWTKVTGTTTYNNTQYNNVTTGLVALNPNKFTINWVFRSGSATSRACIILGTAEYGSLAEAQAATLPELPPAVASIGILVGRIIVEASASSGVVQSAFDVTFSPSAATSHSSLSDLNSDDHPQYALLTGRTGDIFKIDELQEKTAANGVTIDGVILKDKATTVGSGVLGTGTGVIFNNGSLQIFAINSTTLQITTGSFSWIIGSGGILQGFSRLRLSNDAATATVPNVIPDANDPDNGLGKAGTDMLSYIAGGVEFIRATEDTTNSKTELGDVANTNVFEVKQNGSPRLRGNAKAWVDININPVQLYLGAGSNPDPINWDASSIQVAAFDPNSVEEISSGFEINHTALIGGVLSFHVHWSPTNTNTGTVRWGLEYSFVTSGGTPSFTTIYVEQAAGGTAWERLTAEFADITLPSELGAQFGFRFFRDATHVNDTYTGDAAITTTIGGHVEVDSMGSDEKTSKTT